jgi:uncharacterized membrane protein
MTNEEDLQKAIAAETHRVRTARMARLVAEALATLCCGIFFGAAVYISLVQHPAALETGSEFAVRFFAPMYRRASIMQPSLAMVGRLASIVAYFLGADRAWLFSAVLIASVVPITLLVVEPLNEQIMGLDPSAERAVELLMKWSRLHWLRTIASGLSFVLCLVAIVRRSTKFLA